VLAGTQVGALAESVSGAYLPEKSQGPFEAMYDSEALIEEQLRKLDRAFEREYPDETSQDVFMKENKDGPAFKEKAREREELEKRLREEMTPDRYIVKYKSNSDRTLAQVNGISGRIDKAEALMAMAEKNSGSKIEVIKMTERVNPKELVEELKLLGVDKQIEYIQPDNRLSLDSLDKEADASEGPVTEGPSLELVDPEEEPGTEPEEELAGEPVTEPEEELTEDPEDVISEELEEIVEDAIKSEVIVAVIDTGIDVNHPELSGYIWENMEDGSKGWDFVNQNSQVYDPALGLDQVHGTHIAGIIAKQARENKSDVKIMPLKVFENGAAYTSDIIAAIRYAQENGASIVNCSFGSKAENQALREAIEESGMLFVCAVGNNRQGLEEKPSYPACYDLANIISVASVNDDGGFSYFSNYGGGVDITAPGRDVLSTFPENEYGTLTGTSMSAAYVSAAAAAVSASEDLTTRELKNRLLDTADKLSNLQNKVNNGRRANLENAVNNTIQTNIIQNDPADDFDVHGYQMSQSELFELYSSTSVVQIEAGRKHTTALKSDGSVWVWGCNNYGQHGNTIYSESLSRVIGLTDVIAVSAGDGFNLALRADGTVWAFGYNRYGQLGDGTATDRAAPAQVVGLTDITAISAGNYHSMALRSDGKVHTWGDNYYGQLGDGTAVMYTATPVQVTGLNGVTAISAGGCHSLALTSDGKVHAWGYNYYGELGDGTNIKRNAPVQVAALADVTSISAGSMHSMALTSDGKVHAWGYNYYGRLGDGTAINRNAPVQVTALTDITSISAGYMHSLALRSDGKVHAWGYNYYGQLGDGTATDRNAPVQVVGLTGVAAISAGGGYSVAQRSDETLWSWGENSSGQLGNGTYAVRSTPVQVTGLTDVAALSAGSAHSLALRSDSTIWAFGNNFDGQLGDGTNTNRNAPVQVTGLSGVTAISAGYYHSLALTSDGKVWAFGHNFYGQLGDGTNTNRNAPVQVTGLSGVIAISAGYKHSLALTSDGKIWAFGYNLDGQLGDGTNTNSNVPVQVTGLTGVKAISAGGSHSLALKNDGSVWAFGDNSDGQLGDGTNTKRTTPVQVTALSDVTSISAGCFNSLALKNDESVWGFGYNNFGQQRTTPIQVTGLTGVTSVSAGYYHNLAQKSDGKVWAWGHNYYGTLGDGTAIERPIPVQVTGLTGITAISAGLYHNLALKGDEAVSAWGDNLYSQLGLPYPQNSSIPVQSQAGLTSVDPGPNIDMSEITRDITNGDEFIITCSLMNITSLSGSVFKITYDPVQVTLVDFAAQTPELNVSVGAVPGTDLEILSHNTSTGELTFKVNKAVPPDKMLSGAVSALKFKAKVTDSTTIDVEQI